jgi:hypothetical protein
MYAVYLYLIVKFIIDSRDALYYTIPVLKFIRFAVMSCVGYTSSVVELSKGWVKVDMVDDYAETSLENPLESSSNETPPDRSLSKMSKSTSSAMETPFDGLGVGRGTGLGAGGLTEGRGAGGLTEGRGAGLGAGRGGFTSGQTGGQEGDISTQFPWVQQPKSSNFL